MLFANDSFKITNLLGEQTELNNFLKRFVHQSLQLSYQSVQLSSRSVQLSSKSIVSGRDSLGYRVSDSSHSDSFVDRRNGVCSRMQTKHITNNACMNS